MIAGKERLITRLLGNKDCFQMRNFSSTAAIIVALESEPIRCLSATFGQLEARDRKLLSKLSKFVKSEPAYRKALNLSEDPCVPRFGKLGYPSSD
jgi:RasGEF domain